MRKDQSCHAILYEVQGCNDPAVRDCMKLPLGLRVRISVIYFSFLSGRPVRGADCYASHSTVVATALISPPNFNSILVSCQLVNTIETVVFESPTDYLSTQTNKQDVSTVLTKSKQDKRDECKVVLF